MNTGPNYAAHFAHLGDGELTRLLTRFNNAGARIVRVLPPQVGQVCFIVTEPEELWQRSKYDYLHAPVAQLADVLAQANCDEQYIVEAFGHGEEIHLIVEARPSSSYVLD